MNGACMHVYKGVGSAHVGLGCSAIITTMGDMCPEV